RRDHAAAARGRPLADADARRRLRARGSGDTWAVLLVRNERRRRPRRLRSAGGARAAAGRGCAMSRPKSSRWLLAVAFAAVAVAGPAASAPGQPSGVGGGYWIVLASDRDGQTRAYSMRPDGSRLTPLFADGSAQYPAAISADGSTIAYDDLYAGGT